MKVGVLLKRSDYLKEWKPRHFVLDGFQCRYSLPESPGKIHKALDLTMCRINKRPNPTQWGGQRLHTFVLSKPGAGVSYTLGALSAAECDEWVVALKEAAKNATLHFVNSCQRTQVAPPVNVHSAASAAPAPAPAPVAAPVRAPAPVLAPEPPPAPAPAPVPTLPPLLLAPPTPPSVFEPTPPPPYEETPARQTTTPATTVDYDYLLFGPFICWAGLWCAPEPVRSWRGVAFLTGLLFLLFFRSTGVRRLLGVSDLGVLKSD